MALDQEHYVLRAHLCESVQMFLLLMMLLLLLLLLGCCLLLLLLYTCVRRDIYRHQGFFAKASKEPRFVAGIILLQLVAFVACGRLRL